MAAGLSAEQEARLAARNTVQSATGVPVIYAGGDAPAGTEYGVLLVVAAPPVNDMGGYSFSVVRLQLDLYTQATSDTRVGQVGAQAAKALDAAGWNLRDARLFPPEGVKDTQGRRWYRYLLDISRDFNH